MENKSFPRRYYTIWDLVNSELKVLRVRSSENVADILTKPPGPTDFIAIYGKGERMGSIAPTPSEPIYCSEPVHCRTTLLLVQHHPFYRAFCLYPSAYLSYSRSTCPTVQQSGCLTTQQSDPIPFLPPNVNHTTLRCVKQLHSISRSLTCGWVSRGVLRPFLVVALN
jgi:hypothetical protein